MPQHRPVRGSTQANTHDRPRIQERQHPPRTAASPTTPSYSSKETPKTQTQQFRKPVGAACQNKLLPVRSFPSAGAWGNRRTETGTKKHPGQASTPVATSPCPGQAFKKGLTGQKPQPPVSSPPHSQPGLLWPPPSQQPSASTPLGGPKRGDNSHSPRELQLPMSSVRQNRR